MNESIYEYISDHVNEKGELPKDFSLPKERKSMKQSIGTARSMV